MSLLSDEQLHEIVVLKHSLHWAIGQVNSKNRRRGYQQNIVIDVPFSKSTFFKTFGKKGPNTSR